MPSRKTPMTMVPMGPVKGEGSKRPARRRVPGRAVGRAAGRRQCARGRGPAGSYTYSGRQRGAPSGLPVA